MPVVDTLNVPDSSDSGMFNGSAGELAAMVTFDILRESPQLVAEVEAGTLDRRVLETAIVRDIDRNRYYAGVSRNELIRKVFDYMFGYWDLEDYVRDEDVSDIIGTRHDFFFIIKNGVRQAIPVRFAGETQFDSYCKLLAIRNGGILNENDSHCRVSDEKYRLRINVSVRPRNISGPAINIRKHRKKSYTLDGLAGLGMLSGGLAGFFRRLARSDANILFCGKGAAGKTTLLRAVANCFPPTERALVCETDTELYPDGPNFIVQRIKKANEGGRPVTLRDLVRDGLTMSLDTYIVGEIVGDEAWEFIKAGFTGHRVLGTIHAGSAEDALFRLLTLVKSANVDLSEKTLKRIISGSLDVIVYLEDFRVSEVIEVLGYDDEKDAVCTGSLFRIDGCGMQVETGQIGYRLEMKMKRGRGEPG